ncbi:MAG: VRR-NUC domain-containing protein [Planctomycetota bacterium]|nr:VRR-NUC domain-containing protein [Planctomycetota bacterium]
MARKIPLEKTIVAKVMAEARRLGWWSMKNHGNAYSLKGLPDVLVIKEGRAAWMEVKRPGEDPTRIQLHRMRDLAAAGCPVAVVRSAGDAREFLEAIR